MIPLLFFADVADDTAMCRRILYGSDGAYSESWTTEIEADATAAGSSASSRSSARSSGPASASSSVAVSSRNGKSRAAANSSNGSGKRTVTITRDEKGCTIVIDERPHQGNKP